MSSSLAITSPTPRQSAEPSTWFVPLAALATIAGLYAALIYSPADRVERDVMRLLYVHVPAAFSMHIAYGLCFMASVMYLWRRNERWDQVALVGAEVATMFCTVVLLTGPGVGKGLVGHVVGLGRAPHEHTAAVAHLRRLPDAT